MADLISLMLGSSDSIDVYEHWLFTVANKGLKRLYYDVVQTGGKAGIRYATHLIDVVSLAASLRPIIKLTELEQKILFTALSVHDINKSPNFSGQKDGFGKLATERNINQEIVAVGFDEFFPEWRENIVAIKLIIAGHGGKYHSGFSRVIPNANQPENISKERLDILVKIAQAVDKFALARSFSNKKHLEKGLFELNSITDVEYELVWHRLSEQRGLLSNVIHQECSIVLQDNGLHLLLLFPEGNYYLKAIGLKLDEHLPKEIANKVDKRLKSFSSDRFEDFIQAKPLGINIDAQVIEMGLSPNKIWGRVEEIIENRQTRGAFKISLTDGSGQEDKCRERLTKIVAKNKDSKDIAQNWLEQTHIFPQTQSGMAVGELLRTYYIFLSSHAKDYLKDNKIDAWDYLYNVLNIDESTAEKWSVFDKRQDRAYVITKDLNIDFEELFEIIVEDSQKFLSNDNEQNLEPSAIADYVIEVLSISHIIKDKNDFLNNLTQYVNNSSKACAYSSSPYETLSWMSVDVPKGIKVQQFSNRLPAAAREPKRNVSPIVHAQFQLENIAFASTKKNKSLYLHCMPHTFLTTAFIKALKFSLESAHKKGIVAGMLQLKDVLTQLKEERSFNVISLKPSKGNGLPIPNFTDELIANTITLPLNSLGNDSERYLQAIPYAFLFSRFFGVKVLLTESAIPMLSKDEIGDVYLDGIPALFRGLFVKENLSPNAGGIIPEWEIFIRLQEISRQLYVAGSKRNAMLELIAAYLKTDLNIFHVTDRLIEAKTRTAKNSDAAALALSRKILPLLEEINDLRSLV